MLVPCLTCPCSAVTVTVTVDFVTSKIDHGPWHTPRASPFYRPRPHTSASMHLASRIPRGSHLAHRTPPRCGAAIRPTSVPSHTVEVRAHMHAALRSENPPYLVSVLIHVRGHGDKWG